MEIKMKKSVIQLMYQIVVLIFVCELNLISAMAQVDADEGVIEVVPDIGVIAEEIIPFQEGKSRTLIIVPAKSFGKNKPVIFTKPWIVFHNRKDRLPWGSREVDGIHTWPEAIHRIEFNSDGTASVWFGVEFFPEKLRSLTKNAVAKNEVIRQLLKTNGITSGENDEQPDFGAIVYRLFPIRNVILNAYLYSDGKEQVLGSYRFTDNDLSGSKEAIIKFDNVELLRKFCNNSDDIKFSIFYDYPGRVSKTGKATVRVNFNDMKTMMTKIFNDGSGSYVFQDVKTTGIKALRATCITSIDVDDVSLIPFVSQNIISFDECFAKETLEWSALERENNEELMVRIRKYLEPALKNEFRSENNATLQADETIDREGRIDTNSTQSGVATSTAGAITGFWKGGTWSANAALSGEHGRSRTTEDIKITEKRVLDQTGVQISIAEGGSRFEVKKIDVFTKDEKFLSMLVEETKELSVNLPNWGYAEETGFLLSLTSDYVNTLEVPDSPASDKWARLLEERFQKNEKSIKDLLEKNKALTEALIDVARRN